MQPFTKICGKKMYLYGIIEKIPITCFWYVLFLYSLPIYYKQLAK